jgi:hypothetical protein
VPRLPDMPPVDLAIAATAAHHGLTVLHDEEPVVPIRSVPHSSARCPGSRKAVVRVRRAHGAPGTKREERGEKYAERMGREGPVAVGGTGLALDRWPVLLLWRLALRTQMPGDVRAEVSVLVKFE